MRIGQKQEKQEKQECQKMQKISQKQVRKITVKRAWH